MEKSYDYIDNKVFFKKNIFMSRKHFIRLFKVKKKSYFYNLYGRLYDYILGNSVNIKKEYEKYYKKEFKNMREFLIERYNLTDSKLYKYCNRNSYYKYAGIGKENPIIGILYNEDIREIVNNYIGGEISEN